MSELDEFTSLDDDEFSSPDSETAKPGAVRFSHNGRYILPDPKTGKERQFTRVSTIAHTLADTFHLDKWNGRMIAKGMGLRPDLASLAGQYDVTDDKAKLNEIAEKAKEAAGGSHGANLGTALHGYAERLDSGEDVFKQRLAANTRRCLELYRDTITREGITMLPQYMERVVLNSRYEIVGRLDRLASAPTFPHPIVADLKSQKTLDFGYMEIAMQLAIYANADYMWNEETAKWEPMPETDKDLAVIIHLPAQRKRGEEICELHWVDLVEGWRYVRLAMSVRTARRMTKTLGRPVGRDLYWRAQLSACDSVEELSAVFRRAHAAGQWNSDLERFGLQRRDEIQP